MKKNFVVKAIWDEEAQVFVSESDIKGLHIEAATIEEFQALMKEYALELVVANHISKKDLSHKSLVELIPAIFWEATHGMRPVEAA